MASLQTCGRWQILDGNSDLEQAICAATGVTPLAAHIMVARGIDDIEGARRFLTPSLDRDWLDPLLIPGLKEAADRVETAVLQQETIAIFGDFDVDGMSSTCLLTRVLRKLGATVYPYIPGRFDEGYGLSIEAFERLIERYNPSLIVTVDNGIAAATEVELIQKRGIDVVITDHHEPADAVPQGVPVCDPKLDRSCSSCDLAGAGVALKLAHELGRRLGNPQLWRSYTDIAMLGTVSDMMSLTSENRALVADGIEAMRKTERAGIRALAAISNVDIAAIEADTLPFSIIPRLNAAGRMGDVDIAFKLLMSDDPQEAAELAQELESINQNRRDIERELSDTALEIAGKSYSGERAIVVAGEGWHEGVKGIVASRLVNRYHVPSIVFSISDGIATGSGRSVGSVNLFEAVEKCSDLLIRFGGHAGAMGITLEEKNIDAFRARLTEELDSRPEDEFIDTGEISAVVNLRDLDVATINSLSVLRPFGQGNKVPLLAATGILMRSRGRVGRTSEHLRFIATNGMSSVPAIMFRTPDVEVACSYEGVVDLVFEAVAESWQGRVKPKLMVRDIVYRSSDVDVQTPEVVTEIFDRASDIVSDNPLEITQSPATHQTNLSPVTHADESPNDVYATSIREELASLSSVELTNRLVRRLIGEHNLLPAQSKALSELECRNNTLCVMATGRGKSLIFHIHAVREAILNHRVSILVFPLRALVADQYFHLSRELQEMGIGVTVLTGETPEDERRQVYDDLSAGRVDVVLTTPEFLAIHVTEFAVSKRIGFVVIDEAHHAAPSGSGSRSSYSQLPHILEELGQPTCLAVTATAATQAASDICSLCSIDSVIVDEACRNNLSIMDARELRDREDALISLVSTGEKTVCYVNSREQSVELARMLRKANPELGHKIAFYNAGLTRSERMRVEQAFRSDLLSCVISTSAFGEGVNLPDIRHVVLYHMPFGSIEFNQMSGRAGRDGNSAQIHLMFGSKDAKVNENILSSYAPRRDALVCLWKTLKSHASQTGGAVELSDVELCKLSEQIGPKGVLDVASVATGVGIFSELGFIRVEGFDKSRRLHVSEHPRRMELESSIRYLEGMKSIEEFEVFCEWVLNASEDELLARINRPITPGFGTVVH